MLRELGVTSPQERPLLGFGVVSTELAALGNLFPVIRSVSLAQNYASEDHEVGVDARDLTRFADCEFAGHFSSLLFDYFGEHEQALAEAFRVLVNDGLFMTHIAAYRLRDDRDPPEVTGTVRRIRDEGFPTATVGRYWFLDTMAELGFRPRLLQVRDEMSGETVDWFLGVKP